MSAAECDRPSFASSAIVKRLRAEAGPIDSQAAKRAKLLFVYAARIYFERDLRRRIDSEVVVQSREDTIELRWCQQRRRATSEVNRVRMLAVKA